MRRSALILVALTALVACSPKKPPASPAAASAVAAAPPAAAATPAPPEAQSETPPPQVSAEGPPIQYGPPPADTEVRFSPSDYAAKERRITALINNAESRDTTGETRAVAERGRAERQRCSTKACIEHSYAAEEARLRKWEGSGDIR